MSRVFHTIMLKEYHGSQQITLSHNNNKCANDKQEKRANNISQDLIDLSNV